MYFHHGGMFGVVIQVRATPQCRMTAFHDGKRICVPGVVLANGSRLMAPTPAMVNIKPALRACQRFDDCSGEMSSRRASAVKTMMVNAALLIRYVSYPGGM